MKILVDEMPKERTDCPYCKDQSTMDLDEYICTWQGCNSTCYGANQCPYFVQMEVYKHKKYDWWNGPSSTPEEYRR